LYFEIHPDHYNLANNNSSSSLPLLPLFPLRSLRPLRLCVKNREKFVPQAPASDKLEFSLHGGRKLKLSLFPLLFSFVFGYTFPKTVI
jgi:hypothetical protein